ncbi:MAG: class I SAM-dependent methyltransferase [Pseudomonadota bacterium]
MITDQSAQFYAKSASNHDRIYDKPERQHDLAEMRAKLAEVVRGHTVLELACGTGFWSAVMAQTAASVLATDINPEMLALAKLRAMPADKVALRQLDAWDLPADLAEAGAHGPAHAPFTAVFIGFWWSHVKREEQERFLSLLRARLGKDLLLVLLDDAYVDGASPTVARTDLNGNTYHIHPTADGSRYEITKNYPSDSALRKKMASSVREIKIARLEYYWLLSCRLK